MSVRCGICGRPLQNAGSVLRGIGPICFAKQVLKAVQEAARNKRGNNVVLETEPPLFTEGVKFKQNKETGLVHGNVPQVVVWHSPDGFGWGYHGSGAAELALNICEVYSNMLGVESKKVKSIYGETVSNFAFMNHQDFKHEFIAPVSQQEELFIPAQTIKDWLLHRVSFQLEFSF